jgi:hypothetical protein
LISKFSKNFLERNWKWNIERRRWDKFFSSNFFVYFLLKIKNRKLNSKFQANNHRAKNVIKSNLSR